MLKFPSRVRDFSLLHNVQTGSRPHPTSYTVDTGVNQQGYEADHSLPSSVKVKNGGGIHALPHISLCHGVELGSGITSSACFSATEEGK
jgi:hypothetical protein